MHDNQRQTALWPYLAGLIDGEGSFGIMKTSVDKISKSSRSKTTRYMAVFSIGMVDREPIDLIIEAINSGKVYEERVPNRRSMWRIRTAGRFILIPFIQKLLPYLIVKRKRAELLLEFLNNWETPGNIKGIRMLVSDKELLRREEAFLKMRKLNAVGVAATTEPNGYREIEATV